MAARTDNETLVGGMAWLQRAGREECVCVGEGGGGVSLIMATYLVVIISHSLVLIKDKYGAYCFIAPP